MRVISPHLGRGLARRGVLTGAASLCVAACAQSTPASPPAALAFEEVFDAYARTGRFSGVVLAARRDETIYAQSYGLSDRAALAPNTLDTAFNPGSVAKPFLASVILSLADEGVLALERSPSDYLPQIDAGIWRRVTLRQLLSHTAGVVNHSDVDGFFDTVVSSDIGRAGLLDVFASRQLLFEPGSRYRYSNFGYSLLAIVAENVTGAPYAQLLNQRVFGPADMRSSAWAGGALQPARGYVRRFGGEVAEAPASSASANLGAGDIVTTAADLHRFERALVAGRLLSPRSLSEMLTPAAPGAQPNRSYGLGWEIYSQSGRTSMGHAGLALGSTAVIERDPAGETFFAIISNIRDDDAVINNVPPPLIRRMQSDLRALLRGETAAPPRRSLVEQFVADWQTSGYVQALGLLRSREARWPEVWSFEPNEVVLAVFDHMWASLSDCEHLTLYAIERSDEPWLLYETLGDIRSEQDNVSGALSAYRAALRTMPDREYLLERISTLESSRR